MTKNMEKETTFRYTHDGDLWQWRAHGEEGVYYRTDKRGDGVFRIDQNGTHSSIYCT